MKAPGFGLTYNEEEAVRNQSHVQSYFGSERIFEYDMTATWRRKKGTKLVK